MAVCGHPEKKKSEKEKGIQEGRKQSRAIQ